MTGTGSKSSKKPSKPKVDIGPKAYGIHKRGRRLCIRFFVYRRFGSKKDLWFVGDVETGQRAARTSSVGYTSKSDAVRVAREYRDKYGAYGKAPF